MCLEPKIWTWFISRIQYTQTSKGAFCHLNTLRLFSPLWGTTVPLPSLSPDPGLWFSVCLPPFNSDSHLCGFALSLASACLHDASRLPSRLPSSQPILSTAVVSCFDTCWLHSLADSRVSPDLHASPPGTALSASLILSVLPFHVLSPTSWCVFKPDANVVSSFVLFSQDKFSLCSPSTPSRPGWPQIPWS